MILHRIATPAHARDLSGTGAFLYGGRWNSVRTRVIYSCTSLSLAALETIANASSEKIKLSFYCIELDFPDHLQITVPDSLPDEWSAFPYTIGTVRIGDAFIKSGKLCLKVPSAIIPSEFNFLLNPLHPEFSQVKILDVRPLIFDHRLIKL